MSSPEAQRLIKRWEALKATPERANLEAVAKDIEDFIRPGRGDFTGTTEKGRKPTPRRFDDTGIMACNNFQAGMYGMGTSKANRWFALATRSGVEDDNLPVERWLEEVEGRVEGFLQNPRSQFYRHMKPVYGDLGAFGTAILFSHEPYPGSMVFRCVSLAHAVFAENEMGIVDTLVEDYTLTATAAHKRFNQNGVRCHEAARLHEKEPFARLKFLHFVMPNGDFDPRRRLSWQGMPFVGCHIAVEKAEICEKKGFEDFPYDVVRWTQEPGATYGRGIGMDCIATVLGLNAMKRTNLEAAQHIANPVRLLPDESVFGGRVRTHPGDHIYGGMSPEGRPLVAPMQTGGNVPVALEMMQREAEDVREAFFFSLMQMAQNPKMTATEVLERQEEKLRLLGPHLGLLESDLLEPVLKRMTNWAMRNGFLPPLPDDLDSAVQIEFVSPLAQAQRQVDAIAIQRAVGFAGSVSQFNPDAMMKIDSNKAIEEVASALGAPASILMSDDEVAEMKAAQQQQQMLQMGAPIAKDGADAMLKLAQASQVATETANAA